MNFVNLIIRRGISTSCPRQGKRNFRKFQIFNKRGSRIFKEQRKDPNYDLPHDKRGVRDIGYTHNGEFIKVPEMMPQLIVPDLTDCKLKPYVSYRTPDVIQTEFTAQDLFDTVYAPKIAKDFQTGKLNEDGSPKEPSENEGMSPEDARIKARKTGSDIF